MHKEAESEELIRHAREGDPEALGALYSRYSPGVMRVAYYLTGSPHEAEDVLQDVFLGLPAALRRYQPQGNFDAWLRRVAARVALSRMRRQARRAEAEFEESTVVIDSAALTLEQVGLRDALQSLPDTLRAVFVLKEIEGYSHEDIGRTLGITVAASQMRLSRAFRALRKLLGR